MMQMTRQNLTILINSGRIKPDFLDNDEQKFWHEKTGIRLAQLQAEQKDLPRGVKRVYDLSNVPKREGKNEDVE